MYPPLRQLPPPTPFPVDRRIHPTFGKVLLGRFLSNSELCQQFFFLLGTGGGWSRKGHSLIGDIEGLSICILDLVPSSARTLVFGGQDGSNVDAFLFLKFHQGSYRQGLLLDDVVFVGEKSRGFRALMEDGVIDDMRCIGRTTTRFLATLGIL